MHDTLPLLKEIPFPAVRRERLDVLQANLGYRCNQQCLHCHVNAAPWRKEVMTRETVDELLAFMDRSDIIALDLTGGAPELNPHFRDLVKAARQRDVHVMDRCNLTVLDEPGQEDLPAFLADKQVEIIASLPCYEKDNVDQQRGKGVFDTSIRMLRNLNSLGYGMQENGLQLNLVYNPQGAVLPPGQFLLEQDYKARLRDQHNVHFNNLFTLTNMPIQRFGSTLVSKHEFDRYLQLLQDNHESGNLKTVMCRSQISVDWQGYVYDCDFNQMLKLPLTVNGGEPDSEPVHISGLTVDLLQGSRVTVAGHCYGCTAGQGSSCGGALI